MNTIYERLKNARTTLNLSQEFVARQMNMSRPTISAIESGQREVKAEELNRFSRLYGVSVDELLNGRQMETPNVATFARAFSDLDDQDQQEILNLINFKRQYKERHNADRSENNL